MRLWRSIFPAVVGAVVTVGCDGDATIVEPDFLGELRTGCSEPGDLSATPLEVRSRSSFGTTVNDDLEVVRLFCLNGD